MTSLLTAPAATSITTPLDTASSTSTPPAAPAWSRNDIYANRNAWTRLLCGNPHQGTERSPLEVAERYLHANFPSRVPAGDENPGEDFDWSPVLNALGMRTRTLVLRNGRKIDLADYGQCRFVAGDLLATVIDWEAEHGDGTGLFDVVG